MYAYLIMIRRLWEVQVVYKITINIDSTKYWQFRQNLWDRTIVRQPLHNQEVLSNQLQSWLSRINQSSYYGNLYDDFKVMCNWCIHIFLFCNLKNTVQKAGITDKNKLLQNILKIRIIDEQVEMDLKELICQTDPNSCRAKKSK